MVQDPAKDASAKAAPAKAASAKVAPAAEAQLETAPARTTASRLAGAFDYIGWAAIFCAAFVAASQDGLGYLPIHTVPAQWQPQLQTFGLRNALRVEELLDLYDAAAPGLPGTPRNA